MEEGPIARDAQTDRGGGRAAALVLGIVAALIALGVLASRDARRESRAAAPRRAPRPDVILLAVDGLGPTDVAVLGGRLAPTPSLDAVATRGVVYSDAYAPSPWAAESLQAALTGRYRPAGKTDDVTPTLAEELEHLDYRTAIVPGHARHALGAESTDAPPPVGFGACLRPEGMADVAGARADVVADVAIEWLMRNKKPSLLAVSFADPRPPHHLYEGLVGEADLPYDGPARAGLDHDDLLRISSEFGALDLGRLAALHASEIAAADRAIGRVLEAARARRATPPIVVVLGLRAPALGADGRLGLLPSLAPQDLRVPMFVQYPAPLGSIRQDPLRGLIDLPVSLIDIEPTILDALGLEPRLDVDGRSVFPGALAPTRALHASTKRGLRAAVLFEADRALVLECEPTRAEVHTRAAPTSAEIGHDPIPWYRTEAVTAHDSDLRRRLGAWMAGAGIIETSEASGLETAPFTR